MFKRFWFFVALQIGLVLVAIVLVAALGSLGVSRGVGIAVAALLTAVVVFATVYRMKRREEEQVAAMPATEAQRYESRRVRVGFVAGLVGTVFFAAFAVIAQTPQAIFMFALYLVFSLLVGRRSWAARDDESKT